MDKYDGYGEAYHWSVISHFPPLFFLVSEHPEGLEVSDHCDLIIDVHLRFHHLLHEPLRFIKLTTFQLNLVKSEQLLEILQTSIRLVKPLYRLQRTRRKTTAVHVYLQKGRRHRTDVLTNVQSLFCLTEYRNPALVLSLFRKFDYLS